MFRFRRKPNWFSKFMVAIMLAARVSLEGDQSIQSSIYAMVFICFFHRIVRGNFRIFVKTSGTGESPKEKA